MKSYKFTSNSRSSRITFAALAASGLLLVSAGCGGGPEIPDDVPPLTPVTVTVTYNGKPVEGASVLFGPNSGDYAASGVTNASGQAVMEANGMYQGVVAGAYRVSITKRAKSEGNVGTTPTDPAKMKSYMNKVESTKTPGYLVPKKYSTFKNSGLTITVSEGKPTKKTFKLTD